MARQKSWASGAKPRQDIKKSLESSLNVKEYEKKADAIWCDYNKPYDERREEVEKLLHEFCKANGGY